jgi:hypothetical protein
LAAGRHRSPIPPPAVSSPAAFVIHRLAARSFRPRSPGQPRISPFIPSTRANLVACLRIGRWPRCLISSSRPALISCQIHANLLVRSPIGRLPISRFVALSAPAPVCITGRIIRRLLAS